MATISRADLDYAASAALRAAHVGLLQVQQIKAWVDAQTDQQLVGLGYDAAGVADLRTALNVMDTIREVYQGGAPPGAALDYQTFARRVFGLGV